ncbi:MAG: ABC transporter permease [Sediminibacterium sp.]|nr:ABC transporter permease [Sediminibacterium sp.]MBP6144424.1 ABC transporter permease [Sediminibacterium sp.]
MIKINRLNTAFEIAKRISFYKQKNYTRFIVRLSIAATAISVAAILLTFSIVNGFQSTISNKVYSFWGHIQIASVNGNTLSENPNFLQQIKSIPEIQSASPYLNQTMVLAKDIEIEGLNAKGIADFTMIPNLSKGRCIQTDPQTSAKEIVLSKLIATKLHIDTGDQVKLYVLQNGAVQERKLIVVGLFHTGIEEYDLRNVFVDLKLLQQLIQEPSAITGYQIDLKDINTIDRTQEKLQSSLPENWVSSASADVYPQLFDWIKVQSINRNITIVIMLFIAIVNLITCLLILILERVPMIGGLTAMGASHQMIRKVFVYQASFITWMGIGFGVFLGLGISLIQLKFQWIHLDESAYLIDVLPILIDPLQVLGVIVGTALLSYLSFLIPTIWIKKMSPAKAVRFD